MKFDRSLLGSVTVWYNPEPGYVENINSYAKYAGLLVVVDNSALNNQSLFDKIKNENKLYLRNGDNRGIARALNQGLDALAAQNYKFALTLDQDSSFKTEEIEKLLTIAQDMDWNNTGILSPIHLQQGSSPVYLETDYQPVTCVMTSGNILNLEIGKSLGFFNEQLFIDHVDNEYCLRLNKAGYKVLRANALLVHELGRYKDIDIWGIRVGGFISHPPERLYYFVRNSCFILKKYFLVDVRYSLTEIVSLLKRFSKIFFENETKKRLRLYFKGISDSRKLK